MWNLLIPVLKRLLKKLTQRQLKRLLIKQLNNKNSNSKAAIAKQGNKPLTSHKNGVKSNIKKQAKKKGFSIFKLLVKYLKDKVIQKKKEGGKRNKKQNKTFSQKYEAPGFKTTFTLKTIDKSKGHQKPTIDPTDKKKVKIDYKKFARLMITYTAKAAIEEGKQPKTIRTIKKVNRGPSIAR